MICLFTNEMVTIHTKYSNTILYDMMGTGKALKVDSQGNMTIEVPPLSYLVYTQVANPPSGVITDILTTSSKSAGPSFVDTLMFVGLTFNLLVVVNQLKKRKEQ